MKANRRFVNGDDDAVSPVIAVILMVAITVVLAATVYLWVSGFGNDQSNIVNASFAARAVDVPKGGLNATTGVTTNSADADTSDDAIEITYTSGSGNLQNADVIITVDGLTMCAGNNCAAPTATGLWGACAATGDVCSSQPGGNAGWNRGESIFLWKYGADANTPGDFTGTHLLKVVVKNQVVLDTTIEVHDNGGA